MFFKHHLNCLRILLFKTLSIIVHLLSRIHLPLILVQKNIQKKNLLRLIMTLQQAFNLMIAISTLIWVNLTHKKKSRKNPDCQSIFHKFNRKMRKRKSREEPLKRQTNILLMKARKMEWGSSQIYTQRWKKELTDSI